MEIKPPLRIEISGRGSREDEKLVFIFQGDGLITQLVDSNGKILAEDLKEWFEIELCIGDNDDEETA